MSHSRNDWYKISNLQTMLWNIPWNTSAPRCPREAEQLFQVSQVTDSAPKTQATCSVCLCGRNKCGNKIMIVSVFPTSMKGERRSEVQALMSETRTLVMWHINLNKYFFICDIHPVFQLNPSPLMSVVSVVAMLFAPFCQTHETMDINSCNPVPKCPFNSCEVSDESYS